MRRASVRPFVVMLALLAMAGCNVTAPPGSRPQRDETEGVVQQVDELFVTDPEVAGRLVFRTNDPAWWGPYGSTLWTLVGDAQKPFQQVEAQLVKVEGDDTAGYGIVFCCYDTGDPRIGETMLVAMINTWKEFIVGEVTGASFTEIVPWGTCDALRPGYNQANVMRITYATGEYRLMLNGVEAARFRDDEEPKHDQGGRCGYMVVISPLDSFPAHSVHVIFTGIE